MQEGMRAIEAIERDRKQRIAIVYLSVALAVAVLTVGLLLARFGSEPKPLTLQTETAAAAPDTHDLELVAQNTILADRIKELEKKNTDDIEAYNALVDEYNAQSRVNNAYSPLSAENQEAIQPPKPPEGLFDPTAKKAAVAKEDAPQLKPLETFRGGTGGTYIGPRGGEYHYSASGKKVYSKRK